MHGSSGKRNKPTRSPGSRRPAPGHEADVTVQRSRTSSSPSRAFAKETAYQTDQEYHQSLRVKPFNYSYCTHYSSFVKFMTRKICADLASPWGGGVSPILSTTMTTPQLRSDLRPVLRSEPLRRRILMYGTFPTLVMYRISYRSTCSLIEISISLHFSSTY